MCAKLPISVKSVYLFFHSNAITTWKPMQCQTNLFIAAVLQWPIVMSSWKKIASRAEWTFKSFLLALLEFFDKVPRFEPVCTEDSITSTVGKIYAIYYSQKILTTYLWVKISHSTPAISFSNTSLKDIADRMCFA